MTFTQLNARLKNFLRGWLLVLRLKECLVECATLRVKSEVILSIIATSEQGASLLIKNQALEMWTQFMEIVLDRIESYQAKDYAMTTLTHLLRLVRAAFNFN